MILFSISNWTFRPLLAFKWKLQKQMSICVLFRPLVSGQRHFNWKCVVSRQKLQTCFSTGCFEIFIEFWNILTFYWLTESAYSMDPRNDSMPSWACCIGRIQIRFWPCVSVIILFFLIWILSINLCLIYNTDFKCLRL